ncbi:DMT family transporter [Aliikangiella marina]|uniref:DMT family transporter n=1 Tax=Aliikangiella marina TaxID=1712262 RepID=A0A545TJP1_9GAMM|nr:DMT family transporter [Aliikangiella marina]TQV77444.1 DMT family transporter [Aliikangiella marina]
MSERLKASIQLIATMLLVALVTVLAKHSLKSVDAFDFIWLQMFFAIVAISLYTFVIQREKLPQEVPLRAWLIILAMGVCNFTLVRTLFIFALDMMSVTTHAYLINFVGIMTMFLSAIILKEKPTAIQFIGAIVAIVGIQVYFDIFPSGEQLTGILLIVFAVFFLAMTNILMRLLHIKYPQSVSHNLVSCFAVISGGLPIVLYGSQDFQSVLNIKLFDWLIIAANGIVAMALVMNVFNLVMRHLKAFEASILASTGLVFTALISIPILGDSLNARQVAGISLLLIGISCVQIKNFSRRSQQ